MVAIEAELWFNAAMLKAKAIELLGGTVPAAAKAVRVSYQAVDKWPNELPRRISDRVLAALARRYLPPSLIGEESEQAPQGQVAPPVPGAPTPAGATDAATTVGG